MERKKWVLSLLWASLVSVIVLGVCVMSKLKPPLDPSSSLDVDVDVERERACFGYYIWGSKGDGDRILRLLMAVYHPANHYLLHLSRDASEDERRSLAASAASVPAISAFQNVDVVGNPDRFTYMGSSNIATTLRAASILLRLHSRWDWFITLNACDYPLLTPDDLAHVFSSLPRGLNFIDHTSDLGWKEPQRFQPIVVDPAIYLARRSQIFHATERRKTPEAFKVFTGSAWVTLSREFLEYCILGWDNLPRTMLMYFNNVMLSEEGYFQSVICNAGEFMNTTVNNDLRYMIWDSPPGMAPQFLNSSDFDQMAHSGAAFARRFLKDDPVLDMIDNRILRRDNNGPTPGAWCSGRGTWWDSRCSQWGDVNNVSPGPQATKFADSVTNLLDDWNSHTNHCK